MILVGQSSEMIRPNIRLELHNSNTSSNYLITFVEMVRTFLMCKNMYKQFSSFRHPGGYF